MDSPNLLVRSQWQRLSGHVKPLRSRHLVRALVAVFLGIALLIPMWALAAPIAGQFINTKYGKTVEGNKEDGSSFSNWGGSMRFLPAGGGDELATFCVDIDNDVYKGDDYDHAGDMSSHWPNNYWKLVYLMHHYPPCLSQSACVLGEGALGIDSEMAARQAAVWHFSDGFTPETGTTVGDRAWVIIGIVEADAGNKEDYETIAYPHLTLDPPSAEQELTASAFQTYTLTLMQGTTPVTQTEVAVATNSGILDLDGTRTVTSTTSLTVTTDDVGQATFRLWAPEGPAPVTATLTATAEGMTYPAGVVYINVTTSPGQKLILGEETQQDLSTEAEILWKEGTTAVTLSAVSGQSNGWAWLGGAGTMLLSAVAWVVERRPRRD